MKIIGNQSQNLYLLGRSLHYRSVSEKTSIPQPIGHELSSSRHRSRLTILLNFSIVAKGMVPRGIMFRDPSLFKKEAKTLGTYWRYQPYWIQKRRLNESLKRIGSLPEKEGDNWLQIRYLPHLYLLEQHHIPETKLAKLNKPYLVA